MFRNWLISRLWGILLSFLGLYEVLFMKNTLHIVILGVIAVFTAILTPMFLEHQQVQNILLGSCGVVSLISGSYLYDAVGDRLNYGLVYADCIWGLTFFILVGGVVRILINRYKPDSWNNDRWYSS